MIVMLMVVVTAWCVGVICLFFSSIKFSIWLSLSSIEINDLQISVLPFDTDATTDSAAMMLCRCYALSDAALSS